MSETRQQTSEKALEDVVVASLAASPLYRSRPATALDRVRLVDVDELSAFVQTTQPKEWAKLEKQFPGIAHEMLASQIDAFLRKRGTLEVLRHGVSFNGVNLQLCAFKPSGRGNPEHQARYEANRFAVMRQVHFAASGAATESVDVAICLNGLPIASIELKNHFTGQNVDHAQVQYRKRDWKEPFFGRCLVHFAVDDDSVAMTTRVRGKDTVFLPFNRDTENPIVPGRFASSYLWDEFEDDGDLQMGVLRADSWLGLIQNYLHVGKDDRLIFPRLHQLLVVRKLLSHARSHGSGQSYLVQHSAGSGKSNSIAWLAHQLANLCGDDGQPVFDSIVVITDRRVLDKQLQTTIQQFERIKGVVTKIDRNTRQLVKALERGDKIVITTLQKFGFVGELAKLSRRFAVLIDEAHSSQSGENVKDLKVVLTSDEQLASAIEEDTEEGEDPIEAELKAVQKARGRLPHLSFFAFTATPKPKTLELFGTPDPNAAKGFRPFHEYTMRQAIEEGFILDVLESYTTYKTYFELVQNERAEGDKRVEKLKARRLLVEYVDRHDFAIQRKAHVMVDHFTRKSAHKIAGQAKAMIVTHSRAHAVLYKLAIDAILREQNLPFGVLVAFSGTVTIGAAKYTEDGMNPAGTGDIAAAFDKPAQRLLIVANKFQTGFDQPLLHTMYVDKKLGGVAAVQTLSRLNRMAPQKIDTLVLDFVNEHAAVRASFQDYYQRTDLEGATDPNKLYELKWRLEQRRVFTVAQVEEFVRRFFVEKVKSEKLQPLFKKIVSEGYKALSDEEQDAFRKDVARYVRQYSFVSQIMTFVDPALEKLYLFAKLLLRKLPHKKATLPQEILDMVDMDKYRLQEEENGRILLEPDDATLKPSPDNAGGKAEEDRDGLAAIVKKLNEDYAIAFEDADRVVSAIRLTLEKDEPLRAAFRSDSIEFLRRQKLEDSVKRAFLENADEFLGFMARTETEPAFGRFFFSEMFRWYEGTVGRARVGGAAP